MVARPVTAFHRAPLLSLAYFTLIVSLISASVLEIAGAKFGVQLGILAAAISLFAASTSAQKTDREHFTRAWSGVRWLLVFIPGCIALQLVPVWLAVAHPIWTSVHEAMDGTAFGYVTADLGLTLNALFLALAAIALIAASTMVARDRSRAELLLFVLSALMTVAGMVLDLGHRPAAMADASKSGLTTSLAGFGLVLSLALMQLAAERAETRHSRLRSVLVGGCGLVGALINAIAIFGYSSANSAFAAGFGVVLFLLVLLVRRLDLSMIGVVTLSIATFVGAVIVLAFALEQSSGPALLRLVAELPEATRAPLERMLADTRWLGAGAGTSAAVASIYQSDVREWLAPSAAIAVYLDTGWIGLLAAVTVSAALLLHLFFGALRRGRDSFFSAAAAACLCFALVRAFAGPGLLQPAAVFCLSAIVGLGLSQRVGKAPQARD